MNIFRLAGDLAHLMSIIVILLKIYTIKSCAGISLKTQELYVIVFLTRYLDLFTDYISLYNTAMKVIFLVTSIAIVRYMRYDKAVKQSYDKDHDTFRHYFLIIPCFILALLLNEKFTFQEVLWTFSIYLEAVAIIPQMVLLERTRNIDNLTGNYVFLLGAYRGLYLVNWVYRYFTDDHYRRRGITWGSGIVQTLLYADFFYYYIRRMKGRSSLSSRMKSLPNTCSKREGNRTSLSVGGEMKGLTYRLNYEGKLVWNWAGCSLMFKMSNRAYFDHIALMS